MPNKRKYLTEEERAIATRAAKKKWDDKNPEKIRALKREWYHRNKGNLRPVWNLRDRRTRAADGTHSPEDIKNILSSQRGKCAICRVDLGKKFHRDHIVPLSLGGSNWPSNIQLLCPRCNLSKGGKDPLEYMRSIGRLL